MNTRMDLNLEVCFGLVKMERQAEVYGFHHLFSGDAVYPMATVSDVRPTLPWRLQDQGLHVRPRPMPRVVGRKRGGQRGISDCASGGAELRRFSEQLPAAIKETGHKA